MEFTTVLKLYWKETLILTIALAALIPIVGVIIVLASWKYSSRKQKLQVEKKHCLILGGSQGLGKSIALELVKQGAHVTIVARNTTNLKEAVTDLLVHKHNDQLIQYYSVDLMDYDKCVDLFAELRNKNQLPNWLICTNGSANPGFINDQTIQDFTFMMDSNCTSTVNAVKALLQITKQPKNNNVKSSSKKNEISSLIKSDGFIAGISRQQRQLLPDRIVFTGSVLSLLSMIGYSAYSTSRYALRGFADALRSELAPLGIQVHFMMPGNMDTAGFAKENLTKPEITKEIEGQSKIVSPDSCAKHMLNSIQSNRYYISNDMLIILIRLGELARVCVNGGVPRGNFVGEVLCSPLLAIVFSCWAFVTDMDIKNWFKKQNKA